MQHALSKKQVEVLRALESFSRKRGYIPSVRELAEKIDKSATTVFQHLKALERKGYVKSDGSAHGWRVVLGSEAEPVDPDTVRVHLHGTVVAGAPIEAVEDVSESFLLPRELVRTDDVFALRVRGNSMQDDAILHDDLVLVKPQNTVQDGEVAVALLEDGTATLKRIYRERRGKYQGKIRLQPANSEMDPLYVRNVQIQGKVVGVWRAIS